MKSILVLLSSLVLAVLVFLSGVAFTAYVIAEPETHKFAHVDTPDLWTTEPKRVDVASQNYERLPAATPVIAEVRKPVEPAVDQTVTASVDPDNNAAETNAAQEQNPGIDFEHTQFCQARYRSYRVEDNTYQPYNGGPRQQCQSPNTRSVVTAAAEPAYVNAAYEEDLQPIETSAPGGSHEEWCMARYRSYNVADDSYQPFDGGPRRVCQSPFG